jgi:tetratricopeptide (TPR) repeat protein
MQTLDQEALDKAESFFFSGLDHYRQGRFEQSAVDFQKAFTLTHHRDLLFNIARSREQLGDTAGAIEWYRTYLTTKPADETAMIHRIRQLGGDPSPVSKSAVQAKANMKVEEVVDEQGAGVAPWAALGLGAVGLGLGAFMGMQALDEAALARGSEIRSVAQRHKDEAESKALLADVSFAVGAAAVGAAVYFWWSADQEAAASGSVQVGVVPGGASLGYSARF